MTPSARVHVDEQLRRADLAAASDAARRSLTAWRQATINQGLPITQLLACGAGGPDATDLTGCAKTRIPWPNGIWGAVVTFDVDAQGTHLVLIAVGVRHPPDDSRQPSVYQRAHRRLNQ